MSSRALINSLPIPSVDADFFAADAREIYRHADEPIFLFLIVAGKVGDDLVASRLRSTVAAAWKQPRYFNFTNNKTKIAHTPTVTGN